MGIINSESKKEYTIKINNDEFETDVLTGNLNSVIIDSNEYVSVTITSSLGYLIFHNGQTKGINYYAPRALIQGAISNIVVSDQFDKFKLNESINIRVSGPTNVDTTIILRID